MLKPNMHYSELKDTYLFNTIYRKTNEFLAENPDKKVLRMGVGDVSLPLCDAVISQLPAGYHLEHSRSASRNPYDEETEEFIVRAENTDAEIRVYCPLEIQKFTIAGYNVVKDCWLKFHSYRFTHCEFSREDFRELLDLFNKIATQMQIVAQIDDIIHSIVDGESLLLNFDEQ